MYHDVLYCKKLNGKLQIIIIKVDYLLFKSILCCMDILHIYDPNYYVTQAELKNKRNKHSLSPIN